VPYERGTARRRYIAERRSHMTGLCSREIHDVAPLLGHRAEVVGGPHLRIGLAAAAQLHRRPRSLDLGWPSTCSPFVCTTQPALERLIVSRNRISFS
jgi:hypothetical protein